MNIGEYKTIRDEMLQRLRWTNELLVFSLASTGTLLSWLSTKISQPELNPFLFICAGLGVVGLIFHSYSELLRGVHNQGSYIVTFYERDGKDFKWHSLNRFQNELIGKKKLDWGRDGRKGGWLLLFLTIANIVGPLWFLRNNIYGIYENTQDTMGGIINVVLLLSAVTLFVWVCIIARSLFSTGRFIRENLGNWRKIRDKIEKDQNLLETTIKKIVDKE